MRLVNKLLSILLLLGLKVLSALAKTLIYQPSNLLLINKIFSSKFLMIIEINFFFLSMVNFGLPNFLI